MFKLFDMFQDTLEAYSIQNLYIVKHFGSKKLMLEVKTILGTFAFFSVFKVPQIAARSLFKGIYGLCILFGTMSRRLGQKISYLLPRTILKDYRNVPQNKPNICYKKRSCE